MDITLSPADIAQITAWRDQAVARGLTTRGAFEPFYLDVRKMLAGNADLRVGNTRQSVLGG